MRYGIPTCADPVDPYAIYLRNMYHEFFWGPFADEAEVVRALRTLDAAEPMWDYDPFCMVFGANPLPSDYVNGFRSVSQEIRKRVEAGRRAVGAGAAPNVD